MLNHLFVSSCDGALYDTRQKDWSKVAPLRANFSRTHTTIRTAADMKATLRAGQYAWPGGYQQYFICNDGGVLCFGCGKKELRQIIPAIQHKENSGWQVVACDINFEDSHLECEHCGKLIPAAYGD